MKRREEQNLAVDFWPGFTDALLSIVLILVLVVTIFVVTQTGLVNVLGRKESAIVQLSDQLSRLERELKISETRSSLLQGEVEGALALLTTTRQNFQKTSEELSLTRERLISTKDDLALTQTGLTSASLNLASTLTHLQSVREKEQQTSAELEESSRQIENLSKTISLYLEQVKILNAQLTDTRSELVEKDTSLGDLNAAITKLNNQVQALSAQLEGAQGQISSQKLELSKLLGEIEARNLEIEKRDQEIQRLREFEKYRSDFLGQLADVFRDIEDIKVSGDRFVFQGEALFDSGKAELRPDSMAQLDKLAGIYGRLEKQIPPESGLIIQIQGHTDTDPIVTAQFPSNWELSTARATEVVKYLASKGVPRTRLSAAGFSEYFPATEGNTPEAKRQNRRIEIFFTRR
jgi:chemotaxis protein MotB